jgi:hydrogenase maturation protease
MSVETTPRTESRILVIGVGNTYRGDDAVGLIVVERLKNRQALNNVTLLEESGEGAALMEAWRGADAVILVDAVSSGSEPGTIHRLDVSQQTIPANFFSYSTHAFGLAEAIEVARALNALPPRLVVYGIEGKNFAPGMGLSPEVEPAASVAIGHIRREIEGWITRT